MSKFAVIVLKERLPDAMGRPTGWLILGRGVLHLEQREILAILSHPIGLEVARQYTALLAQKWGVNEILEEITPPAVQESQAVEYRIIK